MTAPTETYSTAEMADRLAYLQQSVCYQPSPLLIRARAPLGRRVRRAVRTVARQLSPYGWACVAVAVIGSILGVVIHA